MGTEIGKDARTDLEQQRASFEAMLQEMETDYNRDHFDPRAPLGKVSGLNDAEQTAYESYLVRSCVDEARHAGFLNRALVAEGIEIDLPAMGGKRPITWFPLNWVLYSVYLSEKIGYWRYILIDRHLKLHPLPGVNYVGGRQLLRRVPPGSPPAMAGGGDSKN